MKGKAKSVLPTALLALTAALALLGSSDKASAAPNADKGEVIVYASLDQLYSEPILKRFTNETGIAVRTRFDTEASKTTGLFNRLIAEKQRPRCDVFWNNEIARSVQLKRLGLLQPYASPNGAAIPAQFKDAGGYWTGFAARARVIVYNTKLYTSATAPISILDLAKPAWRKRVGIAYPLFGTTATHGAALFAHLGDARARQYFRDLKANGVQVLDGNAMICKSVALGELAAGLTDTDDVYSERLDGRPVDMIVPDQGPDGLGALLIPNSLVLMRNCPNPENGKRLIDFLLDPRVESALATGRSAQIPVRPGLAKSATGITIESIKTMPVDYEKAAAQMEPSARFLQELFVR